MTNTIAVKDLLAKYNAKQIIIPPYQRNQVWNTTMKCDFICALLDNEPAIPGITIHAEGETWGIVDGQQRITTIIQYLENDLTITKSGLERWAMDQALAGTFSKLPRETQERLMNRELPLLETHNPRKSFIRLQNCKPLTSAERSHGIECELNDYLAQLDERCETLWGWCAFDNARFKTHDVLVACIYMATEGSPARSQKRLEEFHRSFKPSSHEAVCETVVSLLDFMQANITGKKKFLAAANFRAVFLMLLRAAETNVLASFEGKLDALLDKCADEPTLKQRNRLGEESEQKDRIHKLLVEPARDIAA